MADVNNYLDALNSYQGQISEFKNQLNSVKDFDKQESRTGQAISLIADPLGAHLLTSYGGDAITGLKNILAESTQGIRQTLTNEFLGNGTSSLPDLSNLSNLSNLSSRIRNVLPTGPDKTFGDVELTDFVSGDTPISTSAAPDFLDSIAGLARSGPGSLDLSSLVPSGLRSMVGSGLPDASSLELNIQDVAQNLTSKLGIDTASMARNYVDPMLDSVKQSFMDIPEINLSGLSSDATSALTAGGDASLGEGVLSRIAGTAGAAAEGVGEGLEAAGEAIAATSGETIIGGLIGAGSLLAGALVEAFDHNKERLPTLPNVAAPQFIPGLG